MSSLKLLANIDARYKYSVYGWIRKAEQELQLNYIPLMIRSICILYYHDDEFFDKHDVNVIISKDKKTVTKKCMGFDDITYGKYEIPSISDNIYQWDFKIRKIADIVIIGIVSDGLRYTVWSNGWAYKNGAGAGENEKIKYGENDGVSFIYDAFDANIKVAINNGKEYIVFEKVTRSDDIKYKMIIEFGKNAGSCVEMMTFLKHH